jgi:DNA-binding CsgD family transcriptional regulator
MSTNEESFGVSISHIKRLNLLCGPEAEKDLSKVSIGEFLTVAETMSTARDRKLVISKVPGLSQRFQGRLDELRKELDADFCVLGEREDEKSYHFMESRDPLSRSRLGNFSMRPFRPIFELGYRVHGYNPTGPEIISKLGLMPIDWIFVVNDIESLHQYQASEDIVWPWAERSFIIACLTLDNKMVGALSVSRKKPKVWSAVEYTAVCELSCQIISELAKLFVVQLSFKKIEFFYGSAPPSLPRLSEREKEVFARLCLGDSDEEISKDLGISHSTVRKHLSSIFDKTGFTRREKLIAWGSSLKDF